MCEHVSRTECACGDGDDASGERQERQERQVAAVDRQRQLEQVNVSAAMRDA